MSNEYTKRLENVIRQMLTPLKDIPFNLVIEAMTGKKVIPFNYGNSEHKKVLSLLEKTAVMAGREINKKGILRTRPNEVGNDIEPYVKKALNSLKLNASVPECPSGKKKAVGYPDIIFQFNGTPYYLECKTYNSKNKDTSQRSFYLSPSDEFKITFDAVHFMIAFEIYVDGEQNGKHIYKCCNYKILSLDTLSLDVKYEFNSDNKRLYSNKNGAQILREGKITS